jgi:hypothetical protein
MEIKLLDNSEQRKRNSIEREGTHESTDFEAIIT